MATDYESVLCVKNEVFVYRIPARTTNRGYRAADWTLDKPDWTGRLKVVAKEKSLYIKLEDKNSGELFAQSHVDSYPGIAVEQVLDSSRYFVIRITDSGRSAFIGIGFADRADSFDLLVAIQDHFKWLKREETSPAGEAKLDPGPKLDLGFKEGQTITINIGNKKEGSAKPRPKPAAGGTPGLLPPPPGGIKLPAPPKGGNPVITSPVSNPPPPSSSTGISNNMDLLFNLNDSGSGQSSTQPKQPQPPMGQDLLGDALLQPTSAPSQPASTDPWGDFASAGGAKAAANNAGGGNWVQF